ncbi:MAG: glycosyltransferase family 4 protein, partial [Desulfobacteraceae bacterium]|nr:glycosyltransferase family 4 protein [Desulfobacteraceae bacterium]
LASVVVSKFVFLSEAVREKYPVWIRRIISNVRDAPKIPTGVSFNKFDRGLSIRTQLGLGENDVVFGIIGSITRRKGHDRVLTVVPALVRALPQSKVIVVGATNSTEEDEEFLARLPYLDHPAVKIFGYREDIENVMHSIDVLLVPSRHEGQGQVVTQAMACGKPVIGASVGGIKEAVINQETGILVCGDDEAAWLEAMVRLGRDSALRTKMGSEGRSRAKNLYEWNREIGRLFDVIQSCR